MNHVLHCHKNTHLAYIAYSLHHPKDQGTNSLWQENTNSTLSSTICHPFPSFLLMLWELHRSRNCNPPHKTKTGTTNRWGTTNSKPPGPIIMMGQSETRNSSQIIFITLFSAGANCAIILSQNHFVHQTRIFWLFLIQFSGAGSHTKHHWRCSLRSKVPFESFKGPSICPPK